MYNKYIKTGITKLYKYIILVLIYGFILIGITYCLVSYLFFVCSELFTCFLGMRVGQLSVKTAIVHILSNYLVEQTKKVPLGADTGLGRYQNRVRI